MQTRSEIGGLLAHGQLHQSVGSRLGDTRESVKGSQIEGDGEEHPEVAD